MQGQSLHRCRDLFQKQAVGDIWGSFQRSPVPGLMVMVMVTTVIVSVMGGLAFRKRFRGAGALFQRVMASLVIASILVSPGVVLFGFTRSCDEFARTR